MRMPSASFSLPGSILVLKVCKPGAKNSAYRFGKPSLKRRRSGSCSVPVRFPSGTFSYKPGEKPNLHSLMPGGVLASRAVAVFSLRPGRFRWSRSVCRFPLAGFRKPGNPAPLFRQNLPSPYRFLPLPLGRKTRAGLVLCVRSAAALSPRPLFFSGFPASLCVRPQGEPYIAGSGIALPRKKTVGRPRLVRFFFGLPLDIIYTICYYLVVAGTHKTDSFCRA